MVCVFIARQARMGSGGCLCWFVLVFPVPTTLLGTHKCVLSEFMLLKYGEAENIPRGGSDPLGKNK